MLIRHKILVVLFCFFCFVLFLFSSFLFTFLIVSLDTKKNCTMIKLNLYISFYFPYIFGIISKIPLPNPKSWKLTKSQLHSFIWVTTFICGFPTILWIVLASLSKINIPKLYKFTVGLLSLFSYSIYYPYVRITLLWILQIHSSFETGKCSPSNFVLLFSWYFNYSWSFSMPCDF